MVVAMRRVLLLGLAACLGGWLGWRYGAVLLPHGAVVPAVPVPEDGKVANGKYTSEYFDLSYSLPPGWREGTGGPDPSETGYYVLSTLISGGERQGTILIAAQDKFFAAGPPTDAGAWAGDFRQAISQVDGMTIDHEPSEMKIADRVIQRVDFSGIGLYRAMLVTEIRCHFVSFNLTARTPELLASLARSVNYLSHAAGKDFAPSVPECIENYAVAENLWHRVEPIPVGPRFSPIPVRIIIDTDGGVKHVHVIHASVGQRKSIEDALCQWKFKRLILNGYPVEVETGLVFEFKSAQL
jgi:hypothetical protein